MKKLLIVFVILLILELTYIPVMLLLGCELGDPIFCDYGELWFFYVFGEVVLVIIGLIIIFKIVVKYIKFLIKKRSQ